VLSTLNGQLPLAGSTVTLQFGEDGSASGTDGCNRYTTTYTASRSSISFEPAASTMMACPEAVATQAARVLWRHWAQRIVTNCAAVNSSCLDGTKVLATFVAAKEDLAGTTWLVTGYNNGREAVVSPLLGADIIVNIDDANLISGNAGCNDFFAQVQAATNGIHRDRRRRRHAAHLHKSSRRHGTGGEFFAALESAATFSVEGDFIELRNADDAIAVHMVRELEIAIPEPEPGVPTGRVTAPQWRQRAFRARHQLPGAGRGALRRRR
jgi:heat shock protein HslJ